MPAVGDQQAYAAASAATQSKRTLDQIRSTAVSAGFSELRLTGDALGSMLRFPTVDRYWSHADLVYLTASSGVLKAWAAQDWDVQLAATATGFQGPTGAPGNFVGGSWPSGHPNITVLGNSAFGFSLSATTHAFVCTTYASEHCLILTYDDTGDGGTTDITMILARPITSARAPIRRAFSTKGVGASFPITFSAPVGAAHLIFDVDDVELSVTFPTGVPLSAARIAQEVTMQTAGVVEAELDEDFVGTAIIVGVPYDAEPIFGLSNSTPHFSIVYADSTADALGLPIYRGRLDAVSTTDLTLNGVEWVRQGVRIGSTIFNRTKGTSSVVDSFGTSGSQSDTLVGTFPADWLPGHTYVVLPGPDLYCHGATQHGGHQQGTAASSALLTHLSGAVTLTLNDELGEAQGHYQVGQRVMLSSNGLAPILQLDDVTGFVIGDLVTDSTSGAAGLLRAIYAGTSEIVVDVTVAPTSGNDPAFSASHLVTGAQGGSGTIAAIRSSTSEDTRGWYIPATITAVGQVDPSSGDYRTTLGFDLSGINTLAKILPCVIIGRNGKLVGFLMSSAEGSSVINQDSAAYVLNTNVDLQRMDTLVLSTNAPRLDPDHETGSLSLSEVAARLLVGSRNDLLQTFMHFRSVSARNGALAVGDAIDENGDPARRWRFIAKTTPATPYGAGIAGGAAHFWAIGPGAL